MVAGALAATACDRALDGGATPDRVAEIRAARRAVGAQAQVLGTAATDVTARVSALRLGEPPGHRERLDLVDTLIEEAVSTLSSAVTAAEAAQIAGSAPDVIAARRAWDDAREAARQLVGAATTDLAQVERLAGIDARLGEIVTEWDTPGDHSEQLARFEELAARATALADELDGADERPACAEAFARRATAARHVAAASLELRDLVAARDGIGFDARREVLGADPYGLGRQHVAAADVDDRKCWERDGATVVAGRAVEAALRDLEAALDPPDLRAHAA